MGGIKTFLVGIPFSADCKEQHQTLAFTSRRESFSRGEKDL